MKTKAFTLIELLAVIVILAIIAIIATPIILGIIDNAKKGVNRASIDAVVRSANNYYYQSKLNKENSSQFNGTLNLLSELKLENAPDKGAVYIDKSGNVALAIVYDKVCYTKYFDTDIYESDDIANCGVNNEFTTPSSYVNFGGNYLDTFIDVIETSDGGYLAIGNSNSTKYRHGEDINYDGIIVKYNSKGEVDWSNNFGGTGHDYFQSVIEDGDYYVVGGQANSKDYDLEGVDYDSCLFTLKYNKKGKLISKNILYENTSGGKISSIIKYNGYYYLALEGRNIKSSNHLSFVGKYDENFVQTWIEPYHDYYYSTMYEMKLTSNNTLILIASAMKNNGQILENGIHIEEAYMYSTIFEISPNDGSILGASSIGGNNSTNPQDIIEVSDGYIIVGYTKSNTNHFLNMNKGGEEAYIAKIRKTPVDGIFPIEWVKTFGGSLNDRYTSVILDGNQILVTGYSYSSDYDMEAISNSNEGYANAIIVKYEMNGNLINAKSFGGSNTDIFNRIIKSKNNYIVVGESYSTDKDMFQYNYGQSDAIMMKINNNLETVEDLNITPILMSAVPELTINYGESIPQPSDRENLKLYTTNDPTTEVKNWCEIVNVIDPNSNYKYMNCLKPFNSSDIKQLSKVAINLENIVNINSTDNHWILLHLYFGNSQGPHQISNFKVKFEGKEAVAIEKAVELGYIEPLVLSGNLSSGNYYYENSFNIIKGESSGYGRYPKLYILIKPKNIKLEQITFNSEKAATFGDAYFLVQQFHNFDISLTPSK